MNAVAKLLVSGLVLKAFSIQSHAFAFSGCGISPCIIIDRSHVGGGGGGDGGCPSAHRFARTARPMRAEDIQSFAPDQDTVASDLPDTYEDAIQQMADYCAQVMGMGKTRMRIVYDTSEGDETFTLLVATMSAAQQFTDLFTRQVMLGQKADGQVEGSDEEEAQDAQPEIADDMKIAVYFPDTGTAALAARDWKLGTEEALVPPCVRLAAIGDRTQPEDKAYIIVCPRSPEAVGVEKLMAEVDESVPMVLWNPDLINMDVTGYGVVGRGFRTRVLDVLTDSYYLRTLAWGAVAKQGPLRPFSLWQADESREEGYRLIRTFDQEPSGMDCQDAFDIANGLEEEKTTPGFVNFLGDLVSGLQKL